MKRYVYAATHNDTEYIETLVLSVLKDCIKYDGGAGAETEVIKRRRHPNQYAIHATCYFAERSYNYAMDICLQQIPHASRKIETLLGREGYDARLIEEDWTVDEDPVRLNVTVLVSERE